MARHLSWIGAAYCGHSCRFLECDPGLVVSHSRSSSVMVLYLGTLDAVIFIGEPATSRVAGSNTTSQEHISLLRDVEEEEGAQDIEEHR